MNEVYICRNRDWGGEETRAFLAAKAAANGVIVCNAQAAKSVKQRLGRSGCQVYESKFSGPFASLVLSRVIRHLPEGGCQIYAPDDASKMQIQKAIALCGRPQVGIADFWPEIAFPADLQRKPNQNLVAWIGRITPECRLRQLILRFAADDNKELKLRVIGQGDPRTVMPIVQLTRQLGVDRRVEWTGYVDDIYPHLTDVSAVYVDSLDDTVTAEMKAIGMLIKTIRQ